jgi:hypothetical protein
MDFKKIKKKYDELGQTMTSLNGDFQDIVEYQHLDGTLCRFHLATYKELWDGWFAIFSEHNGRVLNHKSSVKWIKKITEDCIYFNEEEDL